ncbi:MAG: hypothetical protein WC624_02590 [Candidatus Margulisiibacteriota bacterium]
MIRVTSRLLDFWTSGPWKKGQAVKRSSGLAVILIFFTFLSANAQELPVGQWGIGGLVVNDTPGNTPQVNPKMVACGDGTYLIVFEDARFGNSDIFAQKIDSQGNLLSDPFGVPVCLARDDQTNPQIVSDGSGGAIIAWQDNRNGNSDIYAQHIGKDGESLWAKDGLPVCSAPEGQFFPEMISDGVGGAIIAWHDYRSGAEDLYAQKINSAGQTVFQLNGIPICTAPGTQWFPKLATDGMGGVIFAWADRRNGNFDIYTQKIDYTGKIIWPENGVPVCVADGNQENVDIAEDGSGEAILVWKDSRPEAPGIYVQKIKGDGAPLLQLNGIPVAQDTGLGADPKIASSQYGGAIIVWSDPHSGDPDVYGQFIGKDGKLAWGESGKPIARLRGMQEKPQIFGNSPFAVIWEDSRSGHKELFAQKITEDGSLLFGSDGVLITDNGVDPQIGNAILTASGEVFSCYQDRKKGNFDIFASHVLANGMMDWINVVNNTPGAVIKQSFNEIWSKDGVVFAFEDFRNGYSNIYLQKVSKVGQLLWGKDGVVAAPGLFPQKNPQVIPDELGGAIVVWENFRDNSRPMIAAQRINSDGSVAWDGAGVILTPKAPSLEQSKPKIFEDGEGGAIVVYCDYRGTLRYKDIFAQRINANGEILWGGQGKVVSAANGNQDDPVISPKTFVVVWTDYRNGDRNSDIFAQKLDLSGNTLYGEDGLSICEAPDSQRDPKVINDGQGGVYIAWTDKGGGSYDIFAQRLDASGRSLFLKDGIPVCQSARTQQDPSLVVNSAGEACLIWEDFRFGNWDIFTQKLQGNGQLVFPEEGLTITNAPGTQYSPSAVANKNGIYLAWEDYRNGKAYNIYMQQIALNGKPSWGPDGFLIKETSLGGRAPKLVSLPDNSIVLGWEDYRYGRRSIYAQRFVF